MKKTILIDLDSTLVDLTTPWLQMYNEEYGDTLTEDQITDWNVAACAKHGDKVWEVLNKPDFFKNLQPFPGAIDFVRDLHESGNYDILIATAPTPNPQTWADKCAWYMEHLGFLGKDCFAEISKKYRVKSDIVFDDSPHTIRAMRETWPDVFIMSFKYGWNKDVWGMLDLKLCDPRNEKGWYVLFEILEGL